MIREDMRFDVRALKHRLRRGEVTPADLKKALDKLPDDAEEMEETVVRFTSPFEDRHHRES